MPTPANEPPRSQPDTPHSTKGGERPRKIYVASSWRNPYQEVVVAVLRGDGHEVYDFKNPRPGDRGFSWAEIDPNWLKWTADEYIAALEHPIAKAGFKSDFDAMKWADTFVLVLPCGRSAHLELGWAVGQGKETLVLTRNGEEPELMASMCDHICSSLEQLRATLTAHSLRTEQGEVRGESRVSDDLRETERLLRLAGQALDLAASGDTSQTCSPGNEGIVVAAMDALKEINSHSFKTSGPTYPSLPRPARPAAESGGGETPRTDAAIYTEQTGGLVKADFARTLEKEANWNAQLYQAQVKQTEDLSGALESAEKQLAEARDDYAALLALKKKYLGEIDALQAQLLRDGKGGEQLAGALEPLMGGGVSDEDMTVFFEAHKAFHSSQNKHTQFEYTAAGVIAKYRASLMHRALAAYRASPQKDS